MAPVLHNRWDCKGLFCKKNEELVLEDFANRTLALRFQMTGRGQSIVLIGFMGAGKSSAGKALAFKTGLPRFDTDEMISKRFRLPVSEIFAQFGEEKFRDAETDALKQLALGVPAIIVTGGGIVLRPENVKMLQELGTVVSLEADEETLFRRISRRPTRPLLQTENPRATMMELLRVREPLYREAADVRLDTSLLGHDELADAVLQKLGKM
ncbi:MAG TPA: shikimate kinase [Chthoniobacterales bacterium]|nr:shikimate kinase [Chthoniobacterales bacterium]